MKKVLFIGVLIITPILTFAQNATSNEITIDKRLYEVFDADFLEGLQQKKSSLLNYYSFFLDHSYFIMTLPKEKSKDLKEIIIDDIENFNILKVLTDQELTRSQETKTMYKIKNSDKVLVFLSGKKFIQKFNEHLKAN